MSPPQEHEFISLSDKTTSSTDKEEKKKNKSCSLDLNETELRLGLPGSNNNILSVLEKKPVSLFGSDIEKSISKLKTTTTTIVSGAKRGFSDAIDCSSPNWGFSITSKSQHDLIKAQAKCHSSDEDDKKNQFCSSNDAPAAKAQVVGWPPIRSYRKNSMASNSTKGGEDDIEGKSGPGCLYVKVSMDGAPYLRKVDLKTYVNYMELSSALEKMFSCFTIGQCKSNGLPARDGLNVTRLKDLLHGSEYVLTYEDKDGDWMLVGDVPWSMFTASCKRLRIMKGSDAIGLAPRAMEKCKSRA